MGEHLGRDAVEVQHEVTISHDFYLSVYEVTQDQSKNVIGANPSRVLYRRLRNRSRLGSVGCVKAAFVPVVCYASQEHLTPMSLAKPNDCRRSALANQDLLHPPDARPVNRYVQLLYPFAILSCSLTPLSQEISA